MKNLIQRGCTTGTRYQHSIDTVNAIRHSDLVKVLAHSIGAGLVYSALATIEQPRAFINATTAPSIA